MSPVDVRPLPQASWEWTLIRIGPAPHTPVCRGNSRRHDGLRRPLCPGADVGGRRRALSQLGRRAAATALPPAAFRLTNNQVRPLIVNANSH